MMYRKKGFGSFLHYINASVEVLLGTNIQSPVLFVIITLAISLKLVYFLDKMKKIWSKLQVLAASKNKLLEFSDFTLLPLTQLHS